MRGFAPARQGPFVSAKVPKTISACARPLWGSSASVPNKMAQELAPLVWSFLLILEKLRGIGGGGTSLRICQLLDRRFETSPIHTFNVDEESRGRTPDRRLNRKLTLVWLTLLLNLY